MFHIGTIFIFSHLNYAARARSRPFFLYTAIPLLRLLFSFSHLFVSFPAETAMSVSVCLPPSDGAVCQRKSALRKGQQPCHSTLVLPLLHTTLDLSCSHCSDTPICPAIFQQRANYWSELLFGLSLATDMSQIITSAF